MLNHTLAVQFHFYHNLTQQLFLLSLFSKWAPNPIYVMVKNTDSREEFGGFVITIVILHA